MVYLITLLSRLWGENFFNPTTKKWSKTKDSENKRSFCMYVLDPIFKVVTLFNIVKYTCMMSYRPVPKKIEDRLIYWRRKANPGRKFKFSTNILTLCRFSMPSWTTKKKKLPLCWQSWTSSCLWKIVKRMERTCWRVFTLSNLKRLVLKNYCV